MESTDSSTKASEQTPEKTPEKTQRKTPEKAPEKTPGETSKKTPKKTPETAPEKAPEKTSKRTSKRIAEKAPKKTHKKTFKRTTEKTPGATSEKTPEATSEKTPGATSEKTPGATSEKTRGKTSGETSKKTPEEIRKGMREKARGKSLVKTRDKCCVFLANPVEIKDKTKRKKWTIIYMYIIVAISAHHADCIEALLTLNADPNVLNGEMGKGIIKKIAKSKCGLSVFARSGNIFHTLLNFGLSPNDFIDNMPQSIDGVAIRPMKLVLAYNTPGSEAILQQKPYGTMSAEVSRKLHQQALSQAVLKPDGEMLRKFVVAGTDKELLRKEIEEKKSKELITAIQAEELNNIVNEN